MVTDVDLSEGDKDLMRNVAHFAARQLKGTQAVYQGTFYSSSLGGEVYILVALGEQALAVQQAITKAQAPEGSVIIYRESPK